MLVGSAVRTQEASFSSLHTFLAWDHRRLSAVLLDVDREVGAGDLPRALRTFSHYQRGVRRHIHLEEETVFQLYANDRTGAARSPKAVLEADHAEILKCVAEMGAALEVRDIAGFRAAAQHLGRIAPDHHKLEEEILCPYIDALLGPVEAQSLIARLRAE